SVRHADRPVPEARGRQHQLVRMRGPAQEAEIGRDLKLGIVGHGEGTGSCRAGGEKKHGEMCEFIGVTAPPSHHAIPTYGSRAIGGKARGGRHQAHIDQPAGGLFSVLIAVPPTTERSLLSSVTSVASLASA